MTGIVNVLVVKESGQMRTIMEKMLIIVCCSALRRSASIAARTLFARFTWHVAVIPVERVAATPCHACFPRKREKSIPSEGKIVMLGRTISKLDTLKFFFQLAWESKLIPTEKYTEDQLIEQLSGIIDKVSLDEIGAKEIIKREITKHNKLRATVLGIKEKEKLPEIDTRNYAKYLLREGTINEKRELIEHLRNRIVLKDKKISVEN